MLSFRHYYVLVILLVSQFCQASGIISNTKYDSEFRTWSAVYMPGRDWRLLKAQCWQESRFKVDARSPVGASGLCQFMPKTFSDVTKQTGFYGSVFDPDLNIQMSAYYMSKKLREFQDVDTFLERDKHAMAAYNAGGGNIMKARKICGSPQIWDKTKQCLPKVTGKHHKETWGYVDAIYKFYTLLIGID